MERHGSGSGLLLAALGLTGLSLAALAWLGSALTALRQQAGSVAASGPNSSVQPLIQSLPFKGATAAAALGPNDFLLSADADPVLFSQLEQGDLSWLPRAEPIPGGGTRYVYKRRSGDPPLSVDQIKQRMMSPPSFVQERGSIEMLLDQLRSAGVTVVLGPPRRTGAAGEWEPRQSLLRIRPDVPSKGSAEFVRVLNHEAIHVAQSCRAGSIRSNPAPLGLSRWLRDDLRRHLEEPLYARVSAVERVLEEEAYANQDNLQLGSQLLAAHCAR